MPDFGVEVLLARSEGAVSQKWRFYLRIPAPSPPMVPPPSVSPDAAIPDAASPAVPVVVRHRGAGTMCQPWADREF